MDTFREAQQQMTEDGRVEDSKALRVFGLYCDYDVTSKFNGLNTKNSVLGLSL